jgi:hypothetical protein
LLRHGYQIEIPSVNESKYTQDLALNGKLRILAKEEHMRWISVRMMSGVHFGYIYDKENMVSPFLIDSDTLEQRKIVEDGNSSFELDKAITKRLLELFQKEYVFKKKENSLFVQ